jgi:putative ABC transport system substrate-binding protein
LNQRTREAFTSALRPLGWIDGKNIQIDYWRAEYDAAKLQVLARELVALKPDVILPISTLAVECELQRSTLKAEAATRPPPNEPF